MPSKDPGVNPQFITQREREILNLIAEGYKSREIADELYISEKAVRENKINLMKKFKAPNISSVIDYALEKGLIDLYEVLESIFSKKTLKPIEYQHGSAKI